MAKKKKRDRTPNIPTTETQPAQPQKASRRRSSASSSRRRNSQMWVWIAAGVIVVAIAALIIINNTTAATAGAPPPPSQLPAELVNRSLKGNPAATVVVTEYSDFECPACKSFAEGLAKQLEEEYVTTGKVLLEYKHYPLPQHEPGASWAANAAECAADQGRFWEMHDYLFQEQGKQGPNTFTQARLRTMAGELGLNTSQFNECLSSQEHAQKIRDDVAEARQLFVNATPTIFVNGQRVDFSYPAIRAVIEAELAKASS